MTNMWFDDLKLLLGDKAEQDAAITADGYFFEVAGADGDGTEITNAETIVSSVTSDLFDGASHEVTGWESASLTLRVEVVSPTPEGLAAGAARLIATCRKPSIRPLSFALQDSAPTSVFDVLVATWRHEVDDLDAVQRRRRVYTLTLRCKPFARSEMAVSLPGLAVGGAYSETVVATGDTTTNWTTTSRYVTRQNLVLNPSFENSTSLYPWTLYTRATSASIVTDAGAPDPTKVARITADALSTGQRSYLYSTVMAVTPGQAYPFTTRIKAGHAGMTTAGLQVAWFDGAGALVGATQDLTAALTTSAYATVASTLTAPTGAVQLRIYPFVQAGSSVPASQFWYFDATAAIDLETVATTTFFDGDNPAAGGLTYYWGSSQGTSGISIETAQATVASSGGRVKPTGNSTSTMVNIPGVSKANLTWTGSIDVGAHRYVRVRSLHAPILDLDGIAATLVATDLSGTYRDYYFAVPAAITTAATVAFIQASGTVSWSFGQLSVVQIATVSHPTSGTGRTIARAVTTVGSMPAEATVEVTNNGNVLGDHLAIYSGSRVGGFQLLRAKRTAGPTQTSASTSISGLTSTLATTQGSADTFEIPVSQLPEATYLLSAFLTGASLTSGTAYTFSYQASIVEDPAGTPVEHSIATGTQKITATGTTFTGKPVDLGLLSLPTTHVVVTGTNSAVVRVQLWVSAGTWTLDEAWLADVDNGQISTIDLASAGLSGKVTSLEIVPAAADRPQQQYLAYSGTAPNQTVREVVPTGWAAHRFDPADGDAQVNVINTATTPGLSVAIEFYPRWDVYAAPIVTEV